MIDQDTLCYAPIHLGEGVSSILHEVVQDTQEVCLPAAIIYILLVYSPIHGGPTKMRVTNIEPAMHESASQLD